MADEKEALGKEFNTLREEITSLKNTLDEIDAEKEKWFNTHELIKVTPYTLTNKNKLESCFEKRERSRGIKQGWGTDRKRF